MTNFMVTQTTETINSIEVANMIGKEHSHLLRDIRRYQAQIDKTNKENNSQSKIGFTDFFTESTYLDEQGKVRPCYNVTRKGCEFLCNKLNSTKGTEFTARYVNRFHELEEGNITTSFVKALNSIAESVNSMNNRLSHLEETQNQTLQELPDNIRSHTILGLLKCNLNTNYWKNTSTLQEVSYTRTFFGKWRIYMM